MAANVLERLFVVKIVSCVGRDSG